MALRYDISASASVFAELEKPLRLSEMGYSGLSALSPLAGSRFTKKSNGTTSPRNSCGFFCRRSSNWYNPLESTTTLLPDLLRQPERGFTSTRATPHLNFAARSVFHSVIGKSVPMSIFSLSVSYFTCTSIGSNSGLFLSIDLIE